MTHTCHTHDTHQWRHTHLSHSQPASASDNTTYTLVTPMTHTCHTHELHQHQTTLNTHWSHSQCTPVTPTTNIHTLQPCYGVLFSQYTSSTSLCNYNLIYVITVCMSITWCHLWNADGRWSSASAVARHHPLHSFLLCVFIEQIGSSVTPNVRTAVYRLSENTWLKKSYI